VRLKKIVLGLSAVAAAAILAACSSGSNASGNSPALAANTGASSVSQSSPAATSTTTNAPTTTTLAPTTTTKTKPPVTTTTKPKPAVQADTTAEAGVPCAITSGACVDLSARKIWLLNNGQIVYGPVHAEPGRTGWSTPIGTFHVISKAQHYVSHEFNAPMPFSVFFAPGFALHEGSATTPSHGCVHLSLSAAETFFHDMSIGDTVQVVR
jgi:lipoprotein-anchoring transpeptidase ErfK/SrfK